MGDAAHADAGATDARGVADAGARVDASTLDGGEGLDAATSDAGPRFDGCPVGAADGCCPLDVVHGGRDPDCPALDCALAPLGPDIQVAPAARAGSATAIGFNGREVVLAYVDTSAPTLRYVFQRRDPRTGASIVPAHSYDLGRSAVGGEARAVLAYDAAGDRWLFALPLGAAGRFGAVLLDAAGDPGTVELLGEYCEPFGVALDAAWPAGGPPRTFGAYSTCMGDAWAHVTTLAPGVEPEVAQVRAAGQGAAGAYIGFEGSFRLLWEQNDLEGPLGWADLDAARGQVGMRRSVPLPIEPQAAFELARFRAGDGGVLMIGATSAFRDGRIQHFAWLGRFAEPGGWSAAAPLTSGASDRRLAEADIVWTGAGYFAVTTEVDAMGSARPAAWDAPRLEQLQVGADGTIVHREPLVDAAAVHAQVAWVGEAVAVTWLQEVPAEGTQRMLRLLGCTE